jgi:hypothetical protein
MPRPGSRQDLCPGPPGGAGGIGGRLHSTTGRDPGRAPRRAVATPGVGNAGRATGCAKNVPAERRGARPRWPLAASARPLPGPGPCAARARPVGQPRRLAAQVAGAPALKPRRRGLELRGRAGSGRWSLVLPAGVTQRRPSLASNAAGAGLPGPRASSRAVPRCAHRRIISLPLGTLAGGMPSRQLQRPAPPWAGRGLLVAQLGRSPRAEWHLQVEAWPRPARAALCIWSGQPVAYHEASAARSSPTRTVLRDRSVPGGPLGFPGQSLQISAP